MSKLSKSNYIRMVQEDIAEIKKHMGNSLERQHIIAILRDSIDCYYSSVKRVPEIEITHKGRTDFSYSCDKIKETKAKYKG